MSTDGIAGKGGLSRLLPRSVNGIVGGVWLLGAVACTLVLWLTRLLPPPAGIPTDTPPPWVLVAFVGLAAAGELVSVRVWRGDTAEDLTFLEAVLVAAILTMPPPCVLGTVLTGLLVASAAQRRRWSKSLFNLGSYAVASSTAVLLYWLLDGGDGRFSWQSVAALTLGTLVFGLINVALMSLVFVVMDGDRPGEFIAAEWPLSAFMAVGGVAVGATAVYLSVDGAYALLPFVAMPILALWYAYGASADHAKAKGRNRWLVTLGGALAQHGRGDDALQVSVKAIRQIVGAPESKVVDPRTHSDRWARAVLSSVESGPEPHLLTNSLLPPGWRNGVVTRLDLGSDEPGALLLGSTQPYRRSRIAGRTRGWELDEADAPVLGALVAAVGSAMRAGAAFEALTEETAKLTAVVDNTSDGIAMLDDNGEVRLWSRTMALMTGVSADELGDEAAEPPVIVRTLVDASRAAAGNVQVHLVRADGEELDVLLSAVRVREATPSAGADGSGWVRILTVHDETRERRVERLKSDFVATISHELRTPITPIKGYAHLLSSRGERMTAQKRAEALQIITERADHLTRLVEDLLLASQVSEGSRLQVVMGVADLSDLVRQAVDSFPQMSNRVRVTPPTVPVAVQCDRIRAVQCLANLIGNAEKYAPGDTPVDITVEVAAMHALVHVRDHGAGIPAAEQDKVFERFYRREDPFTMRTGGAGLGLHIARELAVAMGGGLELRTPAEGTGAEFVLHLLTTDAPARPGTAESAGYRPRPDSAGGPPPGAARHLPPSGRPSAPRPDTPPPDTARPDTPAATAAGHPEAAGDATMGAPGVAAGG